MSKSPQTQQIQNRSYSLPAFPTLQKPTSCLLGFLPHLGSLVSSQGPVGNWKACTKSEECILGSAVLEILFHSKLPFVSWPPYFSNTLFLLSGRNRSDHIWPFFGYNYNHPYLQKVTLKLPWLDFGIPETLQLHIYIGSCVIFICIHGWAHSLVLIIPNTILPIAAGTLVWGTICLNLRFMYCWYHPSSKHGSLTLTLPFSLHIVPNCAWKQAFRSFVPPAITLVLTLIICGLEYFL